MASIAAGCALILPLAGAQPVAVVSPRTVSDAGRLAATARTTSVTDTPRHLLTTGDSPSPAPTAEAVPTATPTRSAAATAAASAKPQTTTTKPQTATAKPRPTASTTTAASLPSSSTATSSAAEQVVAYAREHVGFPYQVGSMGPESYDCAGLVAAAYRSAGYDMPFSEAKQSTGGTYVALADLQPGDVVVWGSPVRAVSLYAGDGVISSRTGPTTASAP